MSVEAVAFDVDGVIAHRDAQGKTALVPGAIEAIHAVQERNIPIFPVTSRDFDRCLWLIGDIGLRDPGVFSGGAAMAEFVPEKRVVWENRISHAITRSLVAEILPFSEKINVGKGNKPVSQYDPLHDVDDDCLGVWAEIPQEHQKEVDDILGHFQEAHGLQSHYNHGTVEKNIAGLYVTAALADKFHTTTRLMQERGIARENTLAIADGDIDIPLFEAVGTRVAMGNASQGLKEVADYHVGDVLAGGFVEAMGTFVLDEEVLYDRTQS